MRPVHVFLGLIVLAMAGAVAYFLMVPGALDFLEETRTVSEEQEINSMALGYVNPPYIDDYQTLRVTGYVDNLSNSEIRAAVLEIQLSDGDGNKKELLTHTVEDIQPGARRPFDANAGTIAGERTAAIDIVELEVVAE